MPVYKSEEVTVMLSTVHGYCQCLNSIGDIISLGDWSVGSAYDSTEEPGNAVEASDTLEEVDTVQQLRGA